MAVVNGSVKPLKRKCFINGQVHHVVRIDRPKGIVYLFNLETKSQYNMTYSDYKDFKKACYRIGEASRALNRHPDRLRYAMRNGLVSKPALAGPENKMTYYFSADNIFELREYFAGLHRGRPRNDGMITSSKVPTREELEARLSMRQMLYVRKEDGTYIPIWKAEEF
ncbi:hypothetical protein UFOVP359_79 [uncultured Caudovirales phage]|uniref:Uncharacterized protein n=1 Tax=uncultured Caudovirales phage TaxID=2100421 RepID=A0A6J7WY93_9CAUD|nr:hypothetical protein UFOVP359_79 [uncultured Caudovirales phage]